MPKAQRAGKEKIVSFVLEASESQRKKGQTDLIQFLGGLLCWQRGRQIELGKNFSGTKSSEEVVEIVSSSDFQPAFCTRHTGVGQELLKHATPDYLVSDTYLLALRLSNV